MTKVLPIIILAELLYKLSDDYLQNLQTFENTNNIFNEEKQLLKLGIFPKLIMISFIHKSIHSQLKVTNESTTEKVDI